MEQLNYLKDLFRHNLKLVIVLVFVSALGYAGVFYDKINVDNLQLDGNTVSSTSGDITLDPDSDLILTDLTANRALYLGASKELLSSSVTDTELGFLSGVSSGLQSQLDGKLSGFSGSSDNALVRTDGASGDTLQESGIIVDDSDNITGVASLNTVSSTELSQLTNIDSTTIGATQWGYLGDLDQGLTTSDTPSFLGASLTDPLTLDHETTPSNPSAGSVKLYTKNDDKLYLLNSSGTETEIGSGGSGQGGINYVVNTDFESNSDDVTVTGNITKGLETLSPLRGNKSLSNIISILATTSDYIEIDLNTIDSADLGKALYISFDYETDDDFSTDDMQVVLYNNDATEEVAVRGGTESGKLAKSFNKVSRFTGVAYLNSTDTDYSLRIKVLSAPTTTSVLYLDNVIVGPEKLIDAPIISEWEDFTPTGSWNSNTTYTGRYRRVGDTAEIYWKVSTSGVPNSAALTLDLPSGLTIDTDKAINAASGGFLGEAHYFEAGVQTIPGRLLFEDTTSVECRFFRDWDGSADNPIRNDIVTQSSPFSWGGGDFVFAKATFPIAEWANQSAVLSQKEMLNETPKARYYLNSSQTVSSTSPTVIEFDTVDFDKTNGAFSFNSSTGVLTANRNMTVVIVAGVRIQNLTDETTLLRTLKDGSTHAIKQSPTVNAEDRQIFDIMDLQKGQTLSISVDSSADSSYELNGASTTTYLSVGVFPDLTVYAQAGQTYKTQTKYLSADWDSTDSNGVSGDLDFSNLTIGQWYEIQLYTRATVPSGNVDNLTLRGSHDGSSLIQNAHALYFNSGGPVEKNYTSKKFKATATTLTFSASSIGTGSTFDGNDTTSETHAVLTEIPPLQETTEW
jgi:hypothetical protein